MKTNKIKIIIVCGPTASGKSRLAIDIAKRFGGEVINADSMQVYRGMDIANAMPTLSEMSEVPHHLFGVAEPCQDFSVAEWLRLARGKIAELASREVMPVIVGGTGLYISSLVDNIIFDEISGNAEFRNEMYEISKTHGNSFLLEKLRKVDPVAASNLHENNVKRIVRALEAFEVSGKSGEKRLLQSRSQPSPYEACMLAVDFDRKELYRRIDSRVDTMVKMGLVEESKRFMPETTSAQALGHKELLPFHKGEETLEFCLENLKKKTRNYAKRQLTWFRRYEKDERFHLLKFTEYDVLLEKATSVLNIF
jgi:tRNA dimethylallyltransferase